MNQLIKKSQALTYVVIVAAVLVFLAIWPTGIIHQTRVSKSDEKVAMESEAVNVEHNLTQMFVAENEYLSAVDLYVCNEMQDETITFRLFDASYTELFNTFYVVPSRETLPGFVHIPVGYEMIPDQEYYYTIEGLSTDLYVNLEDNLASTSIVNGTLAYAGEEFPGYNIIIRYEYSTPFVWWQILLSAVFLVGIAALLYVVIRKLFIGVWTDSEIRVQTVFQIICNPVIVIAGAIFLYLIFPGRKFGSGAVNYAFYGLGVMMLMAFLLYEVNHRRKNDKPFLTLAISKERLPGWLQAAAVAGVLWYCFEYMNGLYDIHHAYATCKILVWFLVAIITTYKREELFNIPNLIWLIAGSILAYFYAKPYAGVVEQGELHKLQAYVIFIGGFVLINMAFNIINMLRKKMVPKRPNILFAALFGIFVLLLVIFRNTREWPAFIVILCVLLYFRMSVWEQRDRLMENLCNGIILNFLMMVIFSLQHRPYHYYIYYRYDMIYHTVTMTATHLTLIIAAVFVKLVVQYKKSHSVKEVLPQMFLFGMACSYMLFTLSRTGYLAAAVMIIALLILLTMLEKQKGKRLQQLGKIILIMLVSCIYLFPITFTLTRTIPSIVNDPVVYEVEPVEQSITKGTASNSELYITIGRFIEVFNSKILGINSEVTNGWTQMTPSSVETRKQILLASLGDNLYASAGDSLEISDVEEEKEDISNGRLEIYREYLKYWNLTGHEEMGVDFPDGSNSGHAHDIYLQVIHDHGIIVGIYFILFMIFAVIVSIRNTKEQQDTDLYQLLIPAVLVGFLIAGIAEWIFHPCNPFGMSVFIVMTPLFYRSKVARRKIR